MFNDMKDLAARKDREKKYRITFLFDHLKCSVLFVVDEINKQFYPNVLNYCQIVQCVLCSCIHV